MNSRPSPDTSPARPAAKPRRAWLAFILSWFFPGLGQFYAGKPAMALAAVLFTMVVLTPLAGLIIVLSSTSAMGLLAGVGLVAVIWLMVPLHAALVARRQRQYQLRPWNRLTVYALAAMAIVAADLLHFEHVFLRYWPLKVHLMPMGSMQPTLVPGDYILSDTRRSAVTSAGAGDVVTFRAPSNPDVLYMKRIVGTSGDVVSVSNGILSLNGQSQAVMNSGSEATEVLNEKAYQVVLLDGVADESGPMRVAENSVFLMGDNRNRTMDSRHFGSISREDIVGLAKKVVFSWESREFDNQGDMFGEFRWERIGNTMFAPAPEE